MPENADQNRVFRFGVFELDALTGELRKDGKVRPRLQGQPLELALQLLARPGEVVTREELCKQLWPADTFVDYDHSLNTAVNKLREALGDSADNPRFVQTLTRQGYRFIAPVQIVGQGSDRSAGKVPVTLAPATIRTSSTHDSTVAADVAITCATSQRVLSDPRELPPIQRKTSRLLFGLLQVLYLGFYISLLAGSQEVNGLLSETLPHPISLWVFVLFVLTAVAGIPIRLYLLSAALFGYSGLSERFRRLFPIVFPLDEIWALGPFLMVDWIGTGLALAATAVLLFLPFSQRSILLMGDRGARPPAS